MNHIAREDHSLKAVSKDNQMKQREPKECVVMF